MDKQTKTFKIGTLDRYGVFIEVQLETKDKGVTLSIVGHTQYRSNCDWQMGGQINDYLRENRHRINYAAGWYSLKLRNLLDIWDRWHLNDLRAECVHQRAIALYLHKTPHEVFSIGEACPYCGYQYGHAWLYEPLPESVVEWFNKL